MNITATTSGASQFLSLESENAALGAVTSLSGELAVLMLETQEQQKQNAREELASARHDFSQAVADQVEALREQADATFRGAMLSGALSIAGSGFQVWGLARDCPASEPPWQQPVGEGLNRLAAPLGTMVGKSYGTADAKSAQGAEEAAKWQIDDARSALNDARQLQDKSLDWLSTMVERDAASTAAILANKA